MKPPQDLARAFYGACHKAGTKVPGNTLFRSRMERIRDGIAGWGAAAAGVLQAAGGAVALGQMLGATALSLPVVAGVILAGAAGLTAVAAACGAFAIGVNDRAGGLRATEMYRRPETKPAPAPQTGWLARTFRADFNAPATPDPLKYLHISYHGSQPGNTPHSALTKP